MVRDLPTASISGTTPVQQGSTARLPVVVSNTFGNTWSLTYTEGTVTKTLTGTGDGNFTITTLPISVNTVVALKTMVLTHNPTATNPGNCANTLNSNTTVTVFQVPNATINTVIDPICQGTTGTAR